MSDLGERLEQLGLAQYLDKFVNEGFDSWQTILDITESDLNALDVRLGHRRKLQRAIAEARGQSNDRRLVIPLHHPATLEALKSDESGPDAKEKQAEAAAAEAGTNTKRKYRRHPRPDEHAPERPPSAYVIFSNQVRESLKGQGLSFTEIARIVGERWQILPTEEREACERQANIAKEKYYSEMAAYKKTAEYTSYQKYLEEFKAKHGTVTRKESKRSKLENEASTVSAVERAAPPTDRRINHVQTDAAPAGVVGSESSPQISSRWLPSASPYHITSPPPPVNAISSLKSPQMGEPYTPNSASPVPATPQQEVSHDYQPTTRGQPENILPPINSTYGQSHPVSTASPSPSGYQPAPVELPSRRSFREASLLPPLLTHEETTLSSEGSVPHNMPSYSGAPYFSTVDYGQKAMRILPQPLPGMGPTPSHPLDRAPPPNSSSQQPQHLDYRYSGSLAALVRAGELARVADSEALGRPAPLFGDGPNS